MQIKTCLIRQGNLLSGLLYKNFFIIKRCEHGEPKTEPEIADFESRSSDSRPRRDHCVVLRGQTCWDNNKQQYVVLKCCDRLAGALYSDSASLHAG